MRWLCWFVHCPWQHVFNARRDGYFGDHKTLRHNVVVGVYQCPRCKTLSIGTPRRDDGSVVDQC